MIAQIQKPLSQQQAEMAQLIAREFKAAGLPSEFGAAAIVNAYYESGLNPGIQSGYVSASGAREDSVGLFQLYINGAGKGMVLSDGTDLRKDPILNTRRIIEEVKNPTYGQAMRDSYASGNRSIAHYSGLFAQDIERCSSCGPPSWTSRTQSDSSKVKREKLSLEFFPTDRVEGSPSSPLWAGAIAVASILAIHLASKK